MRNSLVSRPNPPSNRKALTRQLIFTKTRNDNLNGIKNLNLWGNDLQDLSLLKQMPNLQVISLSVNNIKTLKYFENCVKLQELYLRKNNIQVLNEIEYLINLPQLKVLWLCDNPCSNVKNYRQVIIKNLPFLTKLDNDVITPSERQKFTHNNHQNIDQSQDIEQMINSKVMPYDGNYTSEKPRTNNYLNELEQNQSRFQPNQFDRRSTQKNSQSPLKQINMGKRQILYEQENPSINKIHSKITQTSQSGKKQIKIGNRGNVNEQIKKNFQNARQNGVRNQNLPKALVGNVGDMIYGGIKSSIQQQRNYYEFLEPQVKQKQAYSMNPQFMKPLTNFNNYSNSYLEPRGYEQYQPEPYSSVKKQPNVSPMKQFQVLEQNENIPNQKGSSPNIIMAIMSLLDDLQSDGLEIIKRETERKLAEKRHSQKVSLTSVGKKYVKP